jgi:hypothetical protein
MILVNLLLFVSSSKDSSSWGSKPESLSTIGIYFSLILGMSLPNLAKPVYFGAFLLGTTKLEIQ